MIFSSHIFGKQKMSTNPVQSGDTLDMIIGVSTEDNAVIEKVRASLSSVSSVKLICFCTNMNVFIVRAFKSNFSSEDEVMQACQKAAGDIKLYLKEGSAKEMLSQCSFSNQDDPAMIKEFSQ